MTSRIWTLPKNQQEEVEDQRPGLVLRKKDVGNDILRYGYDNNLLTFGLRTPNSGVTNQWNFHCKSLHWKYFRCYSQLSMTRPVPLSSVPRKVIKTGDQPFEYTVEGGCSEVTHMYEENDY